MASVVDKEAVGAPVKSALRKGSKKQKKRVTFVFSDSEQKSDDESHKIHPISHEESTIRRQLQGTHDMFLYNYGLETVALPESIEYRIQLKIGDEYAEVAQQMKDSNDDTTMASTLNSGVQQSDTDIAMNGSDVIQPPPAKRQRLSANSNSRFGSNANGSETNPFDNSTDVTNERTDILPTEIAENIRKSSSNRPDLESMVANATNKTNKPQTAVGKSGALVKYDAKAPNNARTVGRIPLRSRRHYLKPEWHAPWKLYKVISGHLGWVEALAVDPSNEWFCSGSTDRTIKIWELATGKLKLTLTGHIAHVKGLAVSPRHPYMFSCGDDKMVKCWDLEQNKVIRSYHGHLSGVYCLDLHPTLDILFTGGRDSTCRVWDIRTKAQIMVLAGHKHTVHSLACQAADPQVITGSADKTVRSWDLKTGKTRTILTHHKKSIRSIVVHPREYSFATGGADNIKVWKCPESSFLRNFNQAPGSIIHTMAVNHDNVFVSGSDIGNVKFWDWKTGHNFQSELKPPQPGSLASENAIYSTMFDVTGSRLITGEGDKTIKMWKEDPDATPETHPVKFKPDSRKRY